MIEDDHRTLKTLLRLRPCHHRKEERIKAHVMLNVIAINCLRYLEQKTGLTEGEIRGMTERVSATELKEGRQVWWQASDMPDTFRKALKTIGIAPPPASWTTWRDAV